MSGLVLLLSWPTSLNALAGAVPAGGGAAAAPAAAVAPGAAGGAATTFDGAAAQTAYGPVQVRITVAGGKVTSAQAIQTPSGNGRDQQINAYAIPVLNQEATSASSAKIAMVSGATYTSNGYLTSLQSALDQAHV